MVQNPSAGRTFAIIAEYSNIVKKTWSVKTGIAIKSRNYNVLRPGWLSECFVAGKEVHIKPHNVLAALPNVQARLDNYCDTFGDCFTEDSTPAGLLELFSSFGPPVQGTRAEAAEQELALFDHKRRPMSLFREFVFYFDRYPAVYTDPAAAADGSPARDGGGSAGGSVASRVTALASAGGGGGAGSMSGNILDRYFVEVQARGGGVRDVLSPDVTHVVGNPDARAHFPQLQAIRARKVLNKEKIPQMVSYDWIQKCIDEKEVLHIFNSVCLNLKPLEDAEEDGGGGRASGGTTTKKRRSF